MAWNPNVPTVTNRVQDDLDAIRENFQHLDQLAERVDELQTVSELAPIANDLQTVSGLAPITDDLQAVSWLAPITDDLQTVSGLAPYITALVSSRVVDHNLDVPNPPNGWYVRWENGLQICMVQRLLLGFFNPNHLFVDWTLPAAFVAADYVPIALYDFDEGVDTSAYFVKSLHARNKSTTSVRIDLFSSGMFTSSDIRRVSVLAIGRWK